MRPDSFDTLVVGEFVFDLSIPDLRIKRTNSSSGGLAVCLEARIIEWLILPDLFCSKEEFNGPSSIPQERGYPASARTGSVVEEPKPTMLPYRGRR